MSTGKYNRRDFIKLSAGAAGVTAASATVSYLGAQPSSERIIERVAANTDIACGPLGLIQRADGNSFVVNGKTYPFKDPNTGELRYHEPIRHRPHPHIPRNPRTKPVDLVANQPRIVKSRNGLLEYTLEARYADAVVNGQRLYMRTYNGRIPADTLVIRPGDILRVNHINAMPEVVEPPHDNINHPHGFNDINLHTHGFNTSPIGNEDNVLITIKPGDHFLYEHFLDADHPCGAYWYHPHKHGATGIQVGSGMAGFIMVEGGQDDLRKIPEIAAAKEVHLMLQELYIEDREDGVGVFEEFPHVANFYYSDKIRYEQTVNGFACNEIGRDGSVVIPEIRMRPGEVQHWRLCHGGIFQNWRFSIEGHDSHMIAFDGMNLEALWSVGDFEFISGQRRDLLVKASMKPGVYPVKRSAYKQGAEVNRWPEITLFNLVVEGAPMDMPLPKRLKPSPRMYYIKDEDIVAKREFTFDFIDDTAHGLFLYRVDERTFKPGRTDFTMALGTAEEWVLHNNCASDHPFHFHVNWFELHRKVDAQGNVEVFDPPVWMDCANIPVGGQITLRHRFERYQGLSVFHCHILTHEDEGMMSLIEFIDPEPYSQEIGRRGGVMLSNDWANNVKVTFPHDCVEDGTVVTYRYSSSPLAPTINPAPALWSEQAVDYNRFFTLSAQRNGRPVTRLGRDFIVEVKYSPAQLDESEGYELIPGTTMLYRYDAKAKRWTHEGINLIAITGETVLATTRHLGQFAISGLVGGDGKPRPIGAVVEAFGQRPIAKHMRSPWVLG